MKYLSLRVLTAGLISVFCFMVGILSVTAVLAADAMIYDTSNRYLGTCGKTDTTTWTLEEDLSVTTFQIWYYWQSNEQSVSFTLKKDGTDFLTGTVTRADCDPYQTSWCNGDLAVNKTFGKGTYSLKVAQKSQCAIPSGNGTVRLYGTKVAATQTTEEANQNDTVTDPSLKMIYDTSNHYIGACGMTDTSTWTSTVDMNVTVLQIWYTWQTGETSVPFTLTKDGKEMAKGVLTKTTECQWTWCNGNYTVNKVFPKDSTYTVKVGTARQCKDDKGNGVVRLFGPDPGVDLTAQTTTTGTNDSTTQTTECQPGGANLPLTAAAGVGGLVIGAAAASLLLKRR